MIQSIVTYFDQLHHFSPTLFNGFISSTLLYFLWQFQSSSTTVLMQKILRNHFMCSHYNVVRKRRYHALLLSAFSHASFHHIAVNMYAYLTFGSSVKQILASQGISSLWVFVISAAIVGNIVFLLFDKGRGGSCVGLSGVTLALLAFDALVYPTKELRMIVSFIPITLPAYYLYVGLLGFSVLGICGLAGSGGVAHSTHLGGLLYGAAVYEAFKRGWLRQWNYRARKAYLALRGH
jgi:membrane associated rhomboid family serine protease